MGNENEASFSLLRGHLGNAFVLSVDKNPSQRNNLPSKTTPPQYLLQAVPTGWFVAIGRLGTNEKKESREGPRK